MIPNKKRKLTRKKILIGSLIFFILLIVFFIRPFIPTVMVLDNGEFDYQRQPDLLDSAFLEKICPILDYNNVFYFRIGKMVFISSFLYHDKEVMGKYTEQALPPQQKNIKGNTTTEGFAIKQFNKIKDKISLNYNIDEEELKMHNQLQHLALYTYTLSKNPRYDIQPITSFFPSTPDRGYGLDLNYSLETGKIIVRVIRNRPLQKEPSTPFIYTSLEISIPKDSIFLLNKNGSHSIVKEISDSMISCNTIGFFICGTERLIAGYKFSKDAFSVYSLSKKYLERERKDFWLVEKLEPDKTQ